MDERRRSVRGNRRRLDRSEGRDLLSIRRCCDPERPRRFRLLPIRMTMITMRATPTLLVTLMAICGCATDRPQPSSAQPWSVRMADSIIARHPRPTTIDLDPAKPTPKWNYAPAFAVQAVAEVGMRTGDQK